MAIRGIGGKTAQKVRCTRGPRAALHAPAADHGNRRNGKPPADRARADRGRRVCPGIPGRVWCRLVLPVTRPILFAEQLVNVPVILPRISLWQTQGLPRHASGTTADVGRWRMSQRARAASSCRRSRRLDCGTTKVRTSDHTRAHVYERGCSSCARGQTSTRGYPGQRSPKSTPRSKPQVRAILMLSITGHHLTSPAPAAHAALKIDPHVFIEVMGSYRR